MTDTTRLFSRPSSAVPADDPKRKLSVIDPDNPKLRPVAIVGDTHTIPLSGKESRSQPTRDPA